MQTAPTHAATSADAELTGLTGDFAHAPASWPPSLERVHAAVVREPMDVDEVMRLASGDARLVLRIFAVANSPFFDGTGRALADLRGAVRRIGVPGLRCVLVATALSLWRGTPRLVHLRSEMTQLRQSSCAVAATAWRIARAVGGCGEADALLAGLMHNAGTLALLTELQQPLQTGGDKRRRLLLVAKWHARLGAHIASQWLLPREVVAAMAIQERMASQPSPAAAVPEIALLGSVLAAAVEATRTAHAVVATSQHLARHSDLQLSETAWQEVLGELGPLAGAAGAAFGD
jgi:HD-like signal output (HDOD) protein